MAIYNCARALDDNDIYILQMFDTSPSGLLVKAYRQTESVEYFMPITESELDNAALSRSQQALSKLAESLSLVELSGKLVLMSSITGIIKPKVAEPAKVPIVIFSGYFLFNSFAKFIVVIILYKK